MLKLEQLVYLDTGRNLLRMDKQRDDWSETVQSKHSDAPAANQSPPTASPQQQCGSNAGGRQLLRKHGKTATVSVLQRLRHILAKAETGEKLYYKNDI